MAGLSSGLLADLRKTLLECGPFYSASELRTVFVDERLKPWRNNLPDAASNTGRVDAVISYLLDRRNRNNENALWLLVQVLRDRTDEEDACYDQLSVMAQRLDQEFTGPTTRPESRAATPGADALEGRARLLDLLVRYFTLEEIHTICFELGIDYENISGGGKIGKIRELLGYLERNNRLPAFMARVKQLRPHVNW